MNHDGIYKYQPLFESWQIDEKIGEGSFGVVYKVSKRDMGQVYDSAVKFITVPTKEQFREAESSLGDDEKTLTEYFEDIVKNIVKEIKLLYSLSGNTNIIGYQDHKVIKKEKEIGWDILIRMEYVTSLRKYLKEHAMTKEEAVRLGVDICTALETCSKKGIVHRDIKDENIFVSETAYSSWATSASRGSFPRAAARHPCAARRYTWPRRFVAARSTTPRWISTRWVS